jgi:nonsense-mediated mRNA decay protein 3
MRSKNTGEGILRCPVCGRKARRLIDGVCEVCYFSRILENFPETVTVRICSICGRLETSPETKLRHLIRKHFRQLPKDVTVELKKLSETEFLIEVHLPYYDEVLEKRIKIEFEPYVCRSCARRAGGYYEAIVQFRGKHWEYAAKVFKMLINNASQEGSFISKEEPTKNGVDFRVGSKVVAEQLLKKMEQDYRIGYIAERSFKVVGIDKQTSKPRTRFTYLFRTYDFSPGSAVLYRSRPYKVLGYQGNTIELLDLLSGKRVQKPLNDLVAYAEELATEKGEVIYLDSQKIYVLDKENSLKELEYLDINPSIGDVVEYIEFQNRKIAVRVYGSKEKEKTRH